MSQEMQQTGILLHHGTASSMLPLKGALALHFAHYNFVRIHSSLQVTPAMAAGVTNHLWRIKEMLNEGTML